MATTRRGETVQQKRISAAEQLRERKIESCKKKLCFAEETIIRMEAVRSQIAETEIIGVSVHHKVFGTGLVIEQQHTTFTVKFDSENKRFIMPSAFIDGFLTTENETVSSKICRYRDLDEQIRIAKQDICTAKRAIQMLEKK